MPDFQLGSSPGLKSGALTSREARRASDIDFDQKVGAFLRRPSEKQVVNLSQERQKKWQQKEQTSVSIENISPKKLLFQAS